MTAACTLSSVFTVTSSVMRSTARGEATDINLSRWNLETSREMRSSSLRKTGFISINFKKRSGRFNLIFMLSGPTLPQPSTRLFSFFLLGLALCSISNTKQKLREEEKANGEDFV